jgi:hypothetical protein
LLATINSFTNTKKQIEVAVADIDGNGSLDIIASQRGEVRAFNGSTGFSQFIGSLGSFRPYGNKYTNGVYLAAGNMDGSGGDDIVTGRGSGKSQVKVFSTFGGVTTQVTSFNAYPGTSGVRVAVGNIIAGGTDEIVTTPGKGRTAQVRVYSSAGGAPIYTGLNPYGTYKNGAFVSVGDLDGDGIDDTVVSAESGNRQIVVLDGSDPFDLLLGQFFPFGSTSGSVRTAVLDADGDGDLDIAAALGKAASNVEFFELDGTPIPPDLVTAFFSGVSLGAGG